MDETKEEHPHDLVNIRIWRKTRKALRRLSVEYDLPMVTVLYKLVMEDIDRINKEYATQGLEPRVIPKD